MTPAEPALSAYARILAGDGVARGLIGPREAPRLWDRHLLNCAVVADPQVGLVPAGARCVDVGSGAGLPGIVWAIARPDIAMSLIEPLLRRADFLAQTVTDLGLDGRVRVVRTRAEQWERPIRFDVVTARAVAPLTRLIGWTAPLIKDGGTLVALKGRTAGEELRAARPIAAKAGLVDLRIEVVGTGTVDPPTTVVVGRRGAAQ